MFSHVMIGTDDLKRSKAFYDAVLAPLGIGAGNIDGDRVFYMSDRGTFAVSKPINGEPACHANGGTIGFSAKTPELADQWHAAGLANGGTACEDPPGWREGTMGRLYLAYLRDPAGNKICAAHRG